MEKWPVTPLEMPAGIVPEQAENRRRPERADSRWPACAVAAVTVGVMVLLVGSGVYLRWSSGRAQGTVTLTVVGSPSRAADSDEQFRRLALGTWRDYYQGKRTLTLRPDGTATMVVELTGIKARLFTPRLVLDIAWAIENGTMHRRTVGGHPADKVRIVNKYAGVAVAERILQLTADRMVLLDQDGSRQYCWQRVE
jgi:hypothetical protein